MRTAFKKAAKDNTDILHKHLGEFLEGTWSLARKSTDVIDTYRVRIKTEGKELDSTLVLRNIISDLCCCLDSLERGGCRTIDNNLRMSFEDYCCALQLHADPKAYALFLKEDLDVPKAVTFAKKQRKIIFLHGEIIASPSNYPSRFYLKKCHFVFFFKMYLQNFKS